MSRIENFAVKLADVTTLTPREDGSGRNKKKIVKAMYTRQAVTIVGIKTATSRFLPVSHEGYSNETYVDKLDLLGITRAEFIGRKLKGIERRSHMSLFREMVTSIDQSAEQAELIKTDQETSWKTFFEKRFGAACKLPDNLCLACWNCSLFGGLNTDKNSATFSRIRYFDTFSIEDATMCIQTDDSPEEMAIGNTVGEDLSEERGADSFHRYEYVKAGTRFPFITIVESPTLLDVVGYIVSVKTADQHGYGKYSANNGKFRTDFIAIATGYPMFSVLDMLEWEWPEDNDLSALTVNLEFENAVNKPSILLGDEITNLQTKLSAEFNAYVRALEDNSDE